MTKRVLANTTESLSYLTDKERLAAYQLIIDGCSHIWSKNKLQKEKALTAFNTLAPLTRNDPYFLAHLNSFVFRSKSDSKDIQVFTTFVNALSDANGLPFSPGSKYSKPNLRVVSIAAVQQLDPKLAFRLLELSYLKFSVPNVLNEGTHFPNAIRTAVKRWLQYREKNLTIMKRAQEAGYGPTIIKMYKSLHMSPPDEVASVLRWKQKNRNITFSKSALDFTGLDDLAIAKKIQDEKLPVLGVLGALPRQMTPVIAVALLEQASGNQAVILRRTFEDAGVLKDPEVMKLYEEKIATASTALDRAKTLSEDASKEVKKAMMDAKSTARKQIVGDIGKVFLHLDASPSMSETFEVAREKGAIIAEMVQNPETNFAWAKYDSYARDLPMPKEFTEDAFKAALFAQRIEGGGTNCFALYERARQFGADIDVHISDGNHNTGDLGSHIRNFHLANPSLPKPKAMVWIRIDNGYTEEDLKDGYEENDIPVAVLKPSALSESALVAQAVRTAMMGPVAAIDEIMATPLLKIPEWYYTL